MTRWLSLLALMLALAPVGLHAQEPQVTFDLSKQETVPGQPIVLSVKILVPTFMPDPPVYPTIEVPSLMVRLPERATSPVSERVDGSTWSGVQRRYRLYPLAVGEFTLPAGEIAITYVGPDGTTPVAHSAPLPQISFVVGLPQGARGVSPPILANGFRIEQTVDGEAELPVGAAFTRTLTAHIDGTTAVLIPALTPDMDATLLRGYPKDPAIAETEERGVLSGSRTEETTYVAQAAGTATLPTVSFDWFNLDTGQVETVSLPEVSLTITGAAAPLAQTLEPADIARGLVWALIGLGALWSAYRLLGPRLGQARATMLAAWQGSERHAHRTVMARLRAQDLSGSLAALGHWAAFFPGAPTAEVTALQDALARTGRARFGPDGQPDAGDDAWQDLRAAYAATRARLKTQSRNAGGKQALPPLNPSGM